MSPNDAQQQPQQAPGRNPFSTTPQPVDSDTAAQPKSPKPAWWMVPAAALVGVALGAGATYAFTGTKEEQVSAASAEPASAQSGEANNADTSNPQEDSTTGGTLDELPKLGEPAMSGNEKVIIDSVEFAPTVELRNQDFSSGASETVMESPKNEGTQFVIVSGTVFNEGKPHSSPTSTSSPGSLTRKAACTTPSTTTGGSKPIGIPSATPLAPGFPHHIPGYSRFPRTSNP